jgi:hypothetical protein
MSENRKPTSDKRSLVIPRNVRAECIRRGFEPAEWVARNLGKSLSTARRKLSGSLRFSADEVVTLASLLGLTPDDLMKEPT